MWNKSLVAYKETTFVIYVIKGKTVEVIVIFVGGIMLLIKAQPENYEGSDAVEIEQKPQENRDNSLFGWFF